MRTYKTTLVEYEGKKPAIKIKKGQGERQGLLLRKQLQKKKKHLDWPWKKKFC